MDREPILGALEWIVEQSHNGMAIAAGCATTHGDNGGGLEMLHSVLSDIGINAAMALDTLTNPTPQSDERIGE